MFKKIIDLYKNAFKAMPYAIQKSDKKINSNSKRVQFPVNEKLRDGRHRYFIKYGQKIDRLAK